MNDKEILHIIKTNDQDEINSLFSQACKVREEHYGKNIYLRCLIEISNYCKNDCYYCGIRCSNSKLERYRLTPEEILNCCRAGDKLGLKTFVLQGGEDPWFTGQRVSEILSGIKQEFPSHAITLSIGERSAADYELFFRCGANRYLLRHETASSSHYETLHPSTMTLANRKLCLYNLKKTGYQVGAGFMVGTPYQTPECLLEDLRFMEELQPHMAGIGPFLPQKDTPFGNLQPGDINLCLKMLAMCRILLPRSLIPATTAMETIAPNGRELALKAGANVIMPNLTPMSAKKLYSIYDNKAAGLPEPADNLLKLKEMITGAGFLPDMSRGDAK
ncbi:MAG: [FeFe] hydrogenase H-cluster radical SAM maturase HydE [Treponema sp.]|nr:[FeFe] hydrogenase H-cluster radical SAM maturase HydE [Treponema sp.]